MDLKRKLIAIGIITMLALALPLRAQTGCTDSPEDPTVLLALVGGVGALAARFWRSRSK